MAATGKHTSAHAQSDGEKSNIKNVLPSVEEKNVIKIADVRAGTSLAAARDWGTNETI